MRIKMRKENIIFYIIGLLDAATVVFIIFKLVGIINWSWAYVLLPFWGPIAVAIGIVVLALSHAIFADLIDEIW